MVEIREATAEDVQVICSFDHVARRDEKRKRWIADAITAGKASVAVVDSQVVGYVVLEHAFFGFGFVSMLYISPTFRRKGVGLELMRHAETICKTEKLFASTNESNRPMQSMLDRLGYVHSGVVDNLDEGDPELIYFKRLGS